MAWPDCMESCGIEKGGYGVREKRQPYAYSKAGTGVYTVMPVWFWPYHYLRIKSMQGKGLIGVAGTCGNNYTSLHRLILMASGSCGGIASDKVSTSFIRVARC